MNRFDKILMEISNNEEKGKIKRSITIDYELDKKLKEMKLNVSELINRFLWHYIKHKEKEK